MPTDIQPSTYWLNKERVNDPVIIVGVADSTVLLRAMRHPCKEGAHRGPLDGDWFLRTFRPMVPTEMLELANRALSEAWGESDPEVVWYQGVKSAEHLMQAAIKDMEGFEQPRLFFTEGDIEGLRSLVELAENLDQRGFGGETSYAGMKAWANGRALLQRLENLKGPKDELEQAANHIHALLRREDVSESDHQTDVKAAVEFLGRVGL